MSIIAQTADGDLDLSTGNLVLVTEPGAETAQRLTNLFRMFQGEWFLDTRQGTPWFQSVLGQKNPNIPSLQRLVLGIVLSCPGVVSGTVTLTFNNASRVLSSDIRAVAQSGAILQGELGGAFIVVNQ